MQIPHSFWCSDGIRPSLKWTARYRRITWPYHAPFRDDLPWHWNCSCDDIYFAIISFISHNFRIFIVALRSSWYVTANKLLCETLSNRILAKQTVRKGGACYTWKHSNNMVGDLKEGRCWMASMCSRRRLFLQSVWQVFDSRVFRAQQLVSRYVSAGSQCHNENAVSCAK